MKVKSCTEIVNENFILNNAGMAAPIDPTSAELTKLKKVKWQDMDIMMVHHTGAHEFNTVNIRGLDHLAKGMIMDVEITPIDPDLPALYSPHISIDNSIRGLGLATKIYRATLAEYGYLYAKHSSRVEPIMNHVWKSVSKMPGVGYVKGKKFDFAYDKKAMKDLEEELTGIIEYINN